MKRFLLLAAVMTILCMLQSCGVYHRISTGDNVSVPVAKPADVLPQS